MNKATAASRTFPAPVLIPAMILLLAPSMAACVADGGGSVRSSTRARVLSYSCGPDGTLSVEYRRGSVRLTEPDGGAVELPASPPGQASRYGEAPYALVLEEREALWMKSGAAPVTCRR